MRAFIAIEIPDELKDAMIELERTLGLDGLVFVKKEALHITLQFLGEIDDAQAERVKAALGAIKFHPFTARLSGLSYFSPDFIRVVFVKVAGGAQEISELYRLTADALSSAGIKFEREAYTPHLTIARVKHVSDRSKLISLIERNADLEFGSFSVNSLVFKKSVLTGEGPVYTDLYKLEL